MRLSFLLGAAALSLLGAGCTLEQHNGETETAFKEPFVVDPWQSDMRTTTDGQKACTISSNGLVFVIRKSGQGNIVSVQTSRFMPAGTQLVVTVNGHRYETEDRYFSAKDAIAMAQDFAAGGKAYAEWSQLKATNGRERYTAEYKLAGFAHKLDVCQH